MIMMRVPICLTVCLLLAGCGGGGQAKYEMSPGKGEVQQSQDYADCDWEASKATAGLQDKSDREGRIKELIDKCMQAKGYKTK
jgi:hypothetical protein